MKLPVTLPCLLVLLRNRLLVFAAFLLFAILSWSYIFSWYSKQSRPAIPWKFEQSFTSQTKFGNGGSNASSSDKSVEHLETFDQVLEIVAEKAGNTSRQVAVLIIDNYKKTGANLIKSADQYLKLTSNNTKPISVTYFLFSPLKRVDYPQKKLSDRSSVVFNQIALLPPTSNNPCAVYLAHAEKLGFFNRLHFEFVYSLDARMTFISGVDIFSELAGERVAVDHPSFSEFSPTGKRQFLPYDRRKDSCAYVADSSGAGKYYSGNIFGGSADVVNHLCQATVKNCVLPGRYSAGREPEFHQIINRYFIENRPTITLGPEYALAASIRPPRQMGIKILLSDDQPNFTDTKNASFNENDPQPSFFADRLRRAGQLTDIIRRNYFGVYAASDFSKHSVSTFKFVVNNGTFLPKSSFGLGDRLRGLASSFYLSIATQRYFAISWQDAGANLSAYFDVNGGWYRAKVNDFDATLSAASTRTRQYQIIDDNIEALYVVISDRSFAENHLNTDVISIATNRGGEFLRWLFRNAAFYPSLHAAIPELPEYKANLELPVFLSAALRTLLGRSTPRFDELFKKTINKHVDLGAWLSSTRIGVQVRTCSSGKVRQKCANVTAADLKCFADRVRDIIVTTKATTKPTTLVFVTIDDESAKVSPEIISQTLADVKSTKPVTVFLTRKFSMPDSEQQAFFDWFLLTNMDWLVISQSSFGETASLFSLSPTLRYEGACRFNYYNLH